jgi:hypothetical protein
MMTKRLLCAYTALIFTGFMFTGNQAVAQVTKVFATTVNNSYNSTAGMLGTGGALSTAEKAAITDSDLNTGARFNSTSLTAALTTTGYVEFEYPADLPANTTTYIKFNIQSAAVLQNLLGGGLGNALNGLVSGLLGAQGVSVTARNAAGTTVLTTTSDFNQPSARIVRDSAGNYYVAVRPNAAYRNVRITNTVNGVLGIGTVWMDVFGGYYETGNGTSCASGNYASYNGNADGLLAINLAPVPAVQNAIDNNLTTSTPLNLGVVNAANSYVEEIVYFSGASSASDKYNFRIGMDAALLNINLLSPGIQILGYLGASPTPVYNVYLNDSQFLALNLNLGVAAGQPIAFQVSPNTAIDRIAIRVNGGVNVKLLNQGIQLYEVSRGSFGVAITGGTTFTTGQTATLGTSITGCTSPSYTYAWTGTGGFTSAAATPTIPTTTPGIYTYNVTVTNEFGIRETATTTIAVVAPGTIGGGQTICAGDTPADLTLSGNSANIVRWEKSTDATFATAVTPIATNSATLQGSLVGAVTATTYIRAVTQITGYAAVNSAAVALTVKTSTWNGTTWSNGVPDETTTAVITANFNPTVDLTACSLEVLGNAVVTFLTGRLVTLEKYIKVANGSSVTFENNAHLVQRRDNAVNEGNIVVKRNSSDLFRLDYTLWASPVAPSQTLLSFSPNTLTGRFYQYRYDFDSAINANAERYFPVNPSVTTFQQASSFLIRMPNSDATIPGYDQNTATMVFKGQFTGVPNNGVIVKPISTQGDRYTSVGNPYPSPISVLDFYEANATSIDEASALYFWRKKNNSIASSYATLTKVAYVYNRAINGNPGEEQFGGQQWDLLFNNSSPSTWIINPAQGFLVQAKAGVANPAITFNNAMRRGTHNNQFFKPSQQNDLSRVWLNLIGTDAFSQIALAYTSEATLGLDAGYDGRALNADGAASLFSTAADTKLTIQARPAFNNTDVVALGYSVKNAGEFTISINRKDGVFAQGQDIYVKDNQLGIVHNLSDSDYKFSSPAGEFTNRLQVVYSAKDALGTENPVLDANSVVVYQQENVININSGTTDITGVSVYDIRGRKLFDNNNVNAPQTSITGLQAQHQVLIVEVTTLKGKVSKKIVF